MAEQTARHRYTAYGLAIASDLALPELVADAAPPGAPDLVVRLGPTPDRVEDPVEERVLWAGKPGQWLHDVPNVGRFYVHRAGREVVIERRGGADADLRTFLFGSTLGAILHQRGMFALHASAVALPGGAVAIAGRSGAGKSTTLAELARRGHPVLSDDKSVVRFGESGPEVVPGYPTLRLWEDAAEGLALDPASLAPLREGVRKYLYTAPAFHPAPVPLRAVVVVEPQPRPLPTAPFFREGGAEGLAVTPVAPREAMRVLLHQTYRPRIVTSTGLQADHFRWAARLAGAVPVHRVVRWGSGETLAAVADAVEAVLTEAPAGVR